MPAVAPSYSSFISEPITPVKGTFDPAGMARGEPGLPQKFRWRKKEFVVAEVLEQWKEHGDCRREQDECHAAFVRRRSGSSPTRTSCAYMMHPTQILKPKFSSASAPTIHASTHATPG